MAIAGSMPSEIPARDKAVGVGIPLQFLAKIRMGDGDHRLGALSHGLPFQADHAVFGHGLHDVRPGNRDDGSAGKIDDNAALAHTASLMG